MSAATFWIGWIECLVLFFRERINFVVSFGDVVLGCPLGGNFWWNIAVVVGCLGEECGVKLVASECLSGGLVDGSGESGAHG